MSVLGQGLGPLCPQLAPVVRGSSSGLGASMDHSEIISEAALSPDIILQC